MRIFQNANKYVFFLFIAFFPHSRGRDECNIFRGLTPEQLQRAIGIIRKSILATDMVRR